MQRPLETFTQWLDEAKEHPAIKEPTAMALATATPEGKPSNRIVLLKHFDEGGFCFYTNHTSRKSNEIKTNSMVALCFYWMPLDKQVRIEGRVEKVEDHEADAYFASRMRTSQIGAWASLQSQPLDSRETLEKRIADIEMKYEGQPIPRPPHWHGWRVIPHSIEFWVQRDFRLHDRWVWHCNSKGVWEQSLLYP